MIGLVVFALFLLLLGLSAGNARIAAATAEKTYLLVVSLPILCVALGIVSFTTSHEVFWPRHALVLLIIVLGVLLVMRQPGGEKFYVPYAALNAWVALVVWCLSALFARWMGKDLV